MSHHKTPPLRPCNWEALEEAGLTSYEAHEKPHRMNTPNKDPREAGKVRRARQQFHRARWG